ncbi:hypothetical protein FQR65_LT17975 [Abscondita terminalis]|nr:hypothetical protein FQR65_LT17975 [Abscondita terminalis]
MKASRSYSPSMVHLYVQGPLIFSLAKRSLTDASNPIPAILKKLRSLIRPESTSTASNRFSLRSAAASFIGIPKYKASPFPEPSGIIQRKSDPTNAEPSSLIAPSPPTATTAFVFFFKSPASQVYTHD